MATRGCVNSPNCFCYICGSYTVKKQQRNISNFVRKMSFAYFGIKLGDQDKSWAPHIVCSVCVEELRQWFQVQGFNLKNRKDISYSTIIRSAIRPVPHGPDLPIPSPPDTLDNILDQISHISSDSDDGRGLELIQCVNNPPVLRPEPQFQLYYLRRGEVSGINVSSLDTSYVRATREPEKRRDIHQFAARLTANFQYYCSLRKVNSFESLCDLIISDKLFETLNKETATHIGIRETEDWFRPIDLAKECDIYISSKNGSHKKLLLLMDIPQTPLKIDHKTLNQIKENYPQYLENKNCFLYAVIHLIAQETILLWSPWKYRCGQRHGQAGRCGMQPKATPVFARRRIKVSRTETCELVKVKQKLFKH
ncbi:uncharacterized protein TNCV_2403081 [Trichonephila clavipes]|nr:uncharacterized protein TNCV_2403081 [Trichonephila clavipes]